MQGKKILLIRLSETSRFWPRTTETHKAHKRNFFSSFVHFRHPTDEQLQHVDIIFSNYYNLQSVHFVFVLSVPAHLDNWCFFYFAIK